VSKYNKIRNFLNEKRLLSLFYIIFTALILLPLFTFFIEYSLNFISQVFFERHTEFLTSIIFSPLVEELGKLSLLFLFYSKTSYKRNLYSLLLIGFLFGLSENIIFIAGLPDYYSSAQILNRVITTLILHSVAPLFFLTKNKFPIKFSENKLNILYPVVIHSFWNLLIYFEVNTIFIYLFSLLLIIYLLIKIKRI
jgi:RsiW-degrading membrane proteinase PrsW (M82 family)